MHIRSRSRILTDIRLCRLCIGTCLIFAPLYSAMALSLQHEPVRRSELGLEIRLTDESIPIRRAAATGGTVIQRRSLRISDSQVAPELTALRVQIEVEGDALRINFYVISNNKWDEQEPVAESYLIRAGESIRVSELARFGIEPFELKAIDARPVVLKPGEGPRIANTASLEVEKLERHFDFYQMWLKNKSDKNIVAYEITAGSHVMKFPGEGYSRGGPALAAGATSSALHVNDSEIEAKGIAIRLVVFEDDTFEGDSKLATQYLARAQGVRIQSPSVLRRIEETMKVDDSDLRTAFVKLESELWLIPEALDKTSSIQFLKTKFPAEDEKSLSALYEIFKGGLYDGRNLALRSLGETLRTVRSHEEQGHYTSAVESIRKTLEQLKESFGKIISTQQ